MVAMPCRFLAASLRPTPVDAPSASPDGLRNGWFSHARPLLDRLDRLTLAPYLIAFVVGTFAAMVWQSVVDPAGQAAASAATFSDQQQLDAAVLDTMQQSVDRLAANVATLEEKLTRRLDQVGAGQDQLAASQDQMTREVARLQATLSRNMEPPPRAAPASALAAAQRSSPAPAEASTRSSSDWRRQSCCQWPASASR